VRAHAAAAVGLLLGLAACDEEVGEVAVKVAAGFSVPALAIGPDRFFAPDGERFRVKGDGSPTVLRQAVGAVRLLYDRGGGFITACTFDVKKNRVVTVTLRVVGRELRCEVVE